MYTATLWSVTILTFMWNRTEGSVILWIIFAFQMPVNTVMGQGQLIPIIFVYHISLIQVYCSRLSCVRDLFITQPSFNRRFKIHSGNRLIVIQFRVLYLHFELCLRSVDGGWSTLWALNKNSIAKSLKYLFSLFLRLCDLLTERVKSHITAAWQWSKHSPFAQVVN